MKKLCDKNINSIEDAWIRKALQSNHKYDEKSFKEGIEWAYEHPKKGMVNIDDICDWLEEHLYTITSVDDYDYGEEYLYSDFNNLYDFLNALRKNFEK
jgi:hypothetical protein